MEKFHIGKIGLDGLTVTIEFEDFDGYELFHEIMQSQPNASPHEPIEQVSDSETGEVVEQNCEGGVKNWLKAKIQEKIEEQKTLMNDCLPDHVLEYSAEAYYRSGIIELEWVLSLLEADEVTYDKEVSQ